MSDFVNQASAYKVPVPLQWLKNFQSRQADVWQKVAFPSRKAEEWKYTSLRSLEQGDFFAGQAEARPVGEQSLNDIKIENLDCVDLVFVNGIFSAKLSSLESLPDGVELVRFSQADNEQQKEIELALGSVADKIQHVFATLNSSQFNDGVYCKVAKNTKVEPAIRVVHIAQDQHRHFSVCPRIFFVLEQGAEATLIEHFSSDICSKNAFFNAVTELNVQDNAKLFHYRLHLEHESSLHIGGVHANLFADSTLESFQLAMGGQLKRVDVVVNHLGKGADCELNGVYLPSNKQHVDFHTCIEHAVPHCTTNEVFRGIVSDSAKAVFNGRIHIHKDAQKSIAHLSNKNLLTSNSAEVDTKPELEIYADDVQCAHGATVAQIDENAMHYLLTRGVSREEALVMLSFGFINELVEHIHHSEIADFLRPRLASLFVREPELTRHLTS